MRVEEKYQSHLQRAEFIGSAGDSTRWIDAEGVSHAPVLLAEVMDGLVGLAWYCAKQQGVLEASNGAPLESSD